MTAQTLPEGCPRQIGQYKVCRRLGAGAMGTVYEVEHEYLGVRRALKLFKKDGSHSEFLRKRFLAEGKLLARLDNPRLVRVHDLAFDDATGTKKLNAWGLFDMLGNRGELMLDIIDRSRVPREGNRARWEDQDAVCYADVETDPLRYVPQDVNGKSLCFSRGGHVNFGWAVCPRSKNFPYKDSPFRLCIGPDLMKEKGFRK